MSEIARASEWFSSPAAAAPVSGATRGLGVGRQSEQERASVERDSGGGAGRGRTEQGQTEDELDELGHDDHRAHDVLLPLAHP